MIRFIRKGTLTAALIGFGFAPALSLAGPFSPKSSSRPASAKTEAPKPAAAAEEQVVIVREPGKPDRQCVLVDMRENPDGSKTYHVRAKDNGDLLTVHQRPKQPATVTEKIPTAVENKAASPEESVEQAGGLRRKTPVPVPLANPSTVEPPELPLGVLPTEPEAVKPAEPEPAKQAEPLSPAPLPVPLTQATPVSPSVRPTPTPMPAPEKTRRGGLLQRMFGKTAAEQGVESCPECEKAKGGPIVMEAPAPKETMRIVTEPPVSVPTAMPGVKGMATIGMTPAATPGRATIDGTVPAAPVAVPAYPQSTSAYEPVSIAGGGASPVLPPDAEAMKFNELKKELASALRPTQRMAAADAMLSMAPGRVQEVREMLMAAAQDDPAGCVRATALQALAKLRTRGDAYKTLLDTAMEDEDTEVREVAKYALEKFGK